MDEHFVSLHVIIIITIYNVYLLFYLKGITINILLELFLNS